MILAHQRGRDLSGALANLLGYAEQEYTDPDERLAFVAGYRGERIRYDAWLRAWRAGR
jgi:hypothetical protein